jgi:Ser/Thr protein kinase RdoA (MazF antagonist)
MMPFESLTRRGQLQRLRQLATRALNAYPIDALRLTPLMHGDNTTFRIDTVDRARFVLRIHRPSRKTPDEVRSELLWLTALQHETDLVAPIPVPTRAGELVTVASIAAVPEPRMCVLLRWIPGRFIDDTLTPAHLERVGAFMARLQNSGARFKPPQGFTRGRLDHLCGKPSGISEAFARQHVDNHADESAAIQLVNEICSPADGVRVEKLIHIIRPSATPGR